MTAVLTERLRRCEFDIVHLDALQMAAYEPLAASLQPRAKVVYDWHNIESEAMRRFAENPGPLARKLYARWTARRLADLERRILGSAYGHLVCSDREARQLLELAPQARVEVIDNGVDAAGYTANAAAAPDRLVYVGAMSYHANIDAAVDFARTVWPAVRRRYPQLRLTLVGSDPAPAVLALREVEGVEVTGTVPDVRPYYAEAVAAVVPLRVGGGTRLKILEAMAAGVPVVSTQLGAEGLEVEPGKHLLLAGCEGDWLEAIGGVLTGGAAQCGMVEAARALVRRRYDWEAIGTRLLETYRRWTAIPDGDDWGR
jgi:glycosyltransferase involved in cell wall biosynthesis